jgi:hypothetical protein
MRRSTLKKLLAAALALGILASTPAFAQPVDRVDRLDAPAAGLARPGHPSQDPGEHVRAVAGEPSQDLRGEHARDAARLADQRSGGTVEPRVYWTYDYEAAAPHPAGPAPSSSPHRLTPAAPDDGTPWAAIAAALAGLALFSGGLYVTTRAPRTKTA